MNIITKSKKVGFIGIGGQRCGKNTIYNWLKDHPQISVSSEMELNFFTHHYDRGYYWYEQNFERNNKTLISGEMSSSYLYDKSAPKRVKKYFPEMKIILSVRNPIDRLISALRMDILKKNIEKREIYYVSDTIDNNPTYLEYGLYAKYLIEWISIFPRENIFIINFDNMIKNQHSTYTMLCKFLDVDHSFLPSKLNQKLNYSWIPKSSFLLHSQKMVAKAIRNVGMGKLVDGLINIGLKEIINKMNTDDNSTIINIDDDFENHLMEYFQDDVQNLSKLMDTDLQKIWFE